jgi:hypothetical protein
MRGATHQSVSILRGAAPFKSPHRAPRVLIRIGFQSPHHADSVLILTDRKERSLLLLP